MNTYDVLSAGAADWLRSDRSQPTTPGNSRTILNTPSSSLPQKGREVEEGKCFSLEAELQVLGCILLDASVAFNLLVTAEVSASHFYDLRNRELFRLLEEMFQRGEAIDAATVYHRAS